MCGTQFFEPGNTSLCSCCCVARFNAMSPVQQTQEYPDNLADTNSEQYLQRNKMGMS